jgi:dTDP-4-dehydrorhamnose reductase
MNILVLGITGMLGSTMFRFLSEKPGLTVYGTARSPSAGQYFSDTLSAKIIPDVHVNNFDSLVKVLNSVRPDVVINCVGVIKQLDNAHDPLQVLPLNSLLPHHLAAQCKARGARLIHISTDCVFSGKQGHYRETDLADARDLYGLSKLLGEVTEAPALTLRTSIIGHELGGQRSLLGWFLAQKGSVNGYRKAIFSGLPTVEFSRVIYEFVLPNAQLSGLYHVAAKPISKFDLLSLIAKIYQKDIEIKPSDECVIDRSLIPERFRAATGYVVPEWPDLIERMHKFH